MRMAGNIELRKLTVKDDMLPQFDLVRQLTPSLTKEQYQHYLDRMIPNGYFQVIAVQDGHVTAVSGYWLGVKFYAGPYLEIDNFVVDEAFRHQGIGTLLLEWLYREAVDQDCRLIMLDAYVDNAKAHTFYHRNGFSIRGFHYIRPV